MKDGYLRANAILLLSSLGSGLTGALLSIYLADRGIGLASIGLIFAVGPILAGLFRIPFGYVVDCLGRKKFILIGATGAPLFAIGLIFASQTQHFMLLNIMVTLLSAIFWTAFSAHLFDVISKGKEGLGLAGRNVTLFAASALAPILAGFIANKYGFTKLFMIGAAIAASAILLILTIKDDATCQRMSFKAIKKEYKHILKIKDMKAIAAVIFAVDFIFVFWSIFIPIWLQQNGLSLEAIGAILSINMVVGAALQIPIGKAIDKHPARDVLIPGFLLFWIGGFLFFAFESFFSYLAARIVLGIGSDAAYWPAVSVLAKVTPKKEHGGVVALIFGISTVISGIAALIGGFLTDKFGIAPVLIGVAGLPLLVAIGIAASNSLKKPGTTKHKRHHFRHYRVNNHLLHR